MSTRTKRVRPFEEVMLTLDIEIMLRARDWASILPTARSRPGDQR
jgi:hypothetical protein